MYQPLDEAVHDAHLDADAALSAFADALLAIEAAVDATAAQEPLRIAGARAEAARTACREFELEVQGGAADALPAAESVRYAGECQICARRLKQQLGTLEFLRRSRQREALLLLGGSGGRGGAAGADPEKAPPSALIALGMQTQLESQLALTRMTRTVEATKQLGSSTLATMESQHERLGRVRETVTAQEAQYAMVEAELRELAAGALGDSLTQTLLVLILLSLCFIASWKLSTVGSGDAYDDASPAAGARTYAAISAGSAAVDLWPSGWQRELLSPLSRANA